MVYLHSSTASGNISNSNRPFGTCPSNRNPLSFHIRPVPDMSTTFRKHGRLFEKLRGGNGSIVRNQATRKMVTQTVITFGIDRRPWGLSAALWALGQPRPVGRCFRPGRPAGRPVARGWSICLPWRPRMRPKDGACCGRKRSKASAGLTGKGEQA
jgi:hypothetical protein